MAQHQHHAVDWSSQVWEWLGKGMDVLGVVIQGQVGSGQSTFLVLDHDPTDFLFLIIVSTDNQTMVNHQPWTTGANQTSNSGC
jgi:hypothetical protein